MKTHKVVFILERCVPVKFTQFHLYYMFAQSHAANKLLSRLTTQHTYTETPVMTSYARKAIPGRLR